MVPAVGVPMSRKARDMGHPRLGGVNHRTEWHTRPGPPANSSWIDERKSNPHRIGAHLLGAQRFSGWEDLVFGWRSGLPLRSQPPNPCHPGRSRKFTKVNFLRRRRTPVSFPASGMHQGILCCGNYDLNNFHPVFILIHTLTRAYDVGP